MSGNAVEMNWADRTPAILQAWYLGSETGNAVADVLTGRMNPCGKMPFSVPFKLEDCAAHNFGKTAYPGIDKKVEYKEDILVGYRWHDTRNLPARYPFGHGLSYTTFKYSDAKINTTGNKWTVSVKVQNTGKVGGKEVVQVYVGKDGSAVPRAKKELKAFAKFFLKPGESKVWTFNIDPATDLRYFDEAANAWKTEPGKYTIYIGSSSTDIRQTRGVPCVRPYFGWVMFDAFDSRLFINFYKNYEHSVRSYLLNLQIISETYSKFKPSKIFASLADFFVYFKISYIFAS